LEAWRRAALDQHKAYEERVSPLATKVIKQYERGLITTDELTQALVEITTAEHNAA